jgi:diphthine-ammonia ligase
MKVLALISGGKDSIYNICRCIDEGHSIVALGNLYNQGTISIIKLRAKKEYSLIVTCIRQ